MRTYKTKTGKRNIVGDKHRRGRRNKIEWNSLSVPTLIVMLAMRYARIKQLELEIKELQERIENESQ